MSKFPVKNRRHQLRALAAALATAIAVVMVFMTTQLSQAASNRGSSKKLRSPQKLGMQAPRSSNLTIQPMRDDSNSATNKALAPNLEDHADYFSERTTDSSKTDLKKADDIRRKTIQSIKKLLSDRKKKSTRDFELLLRLGELYVERHDYIRDLEADAYQKAYLKWSEAPEKNRGREPVLTYKISTKELTNAAISFRRLVSDFPKHPRGDAALFALAKTLGRIGDDNAVSYYNHLIRKWPKSRFIPDAHLALGEFYFEKHDMKNAMIAYKAAMQFKDHAAYPYAVYKLGWAYYNSEYNSEQQQAENYRKSITAFKLVIKLADRNRKTGKLDLRAEALKDLVVVWAETEDVDGAWKYFRTIGEEGSFYAMLERLGGMYAEQGKDAKAIEVYERLLRESPSRPTAPEIYGRMVQLYDRAGRESDATATLRGMPELFIGNTRWVSANKADTRLITSTTIAIEKLLHRWGTTYHSRGQKTKNTTWVALGASIYETYLESFPTAASAYEIRFYLAEIQFDQQRFESAAKNYSLVANSSGRVLKFKKSSALNAVNAMAKLVEKTQFTKIPAPGKASSELPIPREKALLAAYMDDYIRLIPNDKQGLAMQYSAAQIYFDYGHYGESIKRFDSIVSSAPNSEQGQSAARLIIGFYYEQAKWNDVIAWAKKIDGIKEFKDSKSVRSTRDTLYAKALVNRAADQEKSGQFIEAAKDLLTFQSEFPNDPNADKAMYMASLNLEKGAKTEESMAVAQTLIQKYPRSAYRADAMANLGSGFEALADFASAAKWYSELGMRFPSDKRSAAALYNSAILNKALAKFDLAEAALTEIRRTHSSSSVAVDATMELATVQERRGRYIEAATTLAALAGMRGADADTQILAMTRKAKILALNLKDPSGRHELDRIRISLSRKGSPVAAQARQELAASLFAQVDNGFVQFMNARILSGSNIEGQIQAKQGILERAAAGYEAVIALGSPEHTVASLYRLGEMHDDFAEKLFNVQPARDMNENQALGFRSKMDKLAFPLREEAGKFFEVAQKRGSEVETFSEWTGLVEKKLAEINGKRSTIEAMMVLAPQYTSQKFTLNSATRELVE